MPIDEISFQWTTAALVNGEKTVTRRQWKPQYAEGFRSGNEVIATDRRSQYGGQQIALLQLVETPYLELSWQQMTDSEFYAEGFGFYDKYPSLVPSGWKQTFADYEVSNFREYAELKRRYYSSNEAREQNYVVRFRVIKLLHPEADRYLLHNLLRTISVKD